jgi:hypothetical protein
MSKKYIIVKPGDETEKENEVIKARIWAMHLIIYHYQSLRWFRLNKHVPAHKDTIYGPGIKWDFTTNPMKIKPQTQEDKAKAEYAERILFQFLRSIEALEKIQSK